MYTIIGSGFGLYGYLPAIVAGLGETVLLPRAYEAKVRARTELVHTLPAIRWVDDEDAAILLASTVVVATPPQRQCEVVSRCVTLRGVEKFVLEKPLAVTPTLASALVTKLDEAQKRYRIGYTLLHTSWYRQLVWPKFLAQGGRVTISWAFMAHHFAHRLTTWKRVHNEGGGVLRFFGIHIVALLAHHGYEDVHSSVLEGENPNEPERWHAVFCGPGLSDCQVHVDSRSTTKRFEIVQCLGECRRVILRMSDPFEQELRNDGQDSRVAVLERMLGTLTANDRPFHTFYKHVNMLWQKIEGA